MELGRGENWIGGRWRPAELGQEFELGPRAPGLRPRRWPRSGAADLELALEAARGARAWRELEGRERLELLGAALGALDDDQRGAGELAQALGLEEPELAPLRARARTAALRGLEGELEPQEGSSAGATLVFARAGGLHRAALEALLAPLAVGEAVILVSDPSLPELAVELARAFELAGLPPGALALLHDDSRTLLRCAAAHPELSRARLAGCEEDAHELAAFAEAARASRSARSEAPLLLESRPLRRGSAAVLQAEDLGQRAAELARAAFGRAEALGGQLEGQVGRVLCHEAVFSPFSEALLAEVDRLSEGARPLRLLDPELPDRVGRLLRLGLDEGATLVRGPAEPPSGSQPLGAEVTLLPSVFTNAEPRQRLVRASRPAPVLALLRAADDEAARALAGELSPPGRAWLLATRPPPAGSERP